ncbi:Holliday junction branch migration protein RuvA [Ereboglobus luteus]|uniref:Holliday junction branch migration complex subunit RuvA n=1 Tax=Ereboglobus luteus TaxID=1796921 RepID=A0A2U8E5F9_9BACT|nr:Holliday junction branch migration protein RuvA [Ereboglobus luteus]AWI10093.1 Holliday junction branch migration protein RuvA [Ereboglobus luteus]
MIVSIQGTLAAATPLHATIEINGLGYGVNIPVTTAEKLPAAGSNVKLHTVAIYREDSQTLYGFATTEERDFFQLMINNVSGIGPKSALTIMSKLSLASLESAIRMGDIATLSKCPGIGKKTAERLVVELRGKLGTGTATGDSPIATNASGEPQAAGDSRIRDAVLALAALGYKTAAADEAIRRANLALGPKATTEQLIKKALG